MNWNSNDLRSTVATKVTDKLNEFERQRTHLLQFQMVTLNALGSLELNMPKIEAALKLIDLEITEVKPHTHYGDKQDYNEETPLYVDLICKMIGRRKPLHQEHYRISRAEENRRREQCEKWQNKVKEAGYRIDINQFSLDKPERVLVSLKY